MTPPAQDRTHPNLTLAVLSLGGMAYAMLSSMVVPALPTMQHHRDWDHLAADRLPASEASGSTA